MPNRHGFNELPIRGEIVRRCIWCDQRAPRSGEHFMARHARKHRKDVEAAAEASRKELLTAQTAIVV